MSTIRHRTFNYNLLDIPAIIHTNYNTITVQLPQCNTYEN